MLWVSVGGLKGGHLKRTLDSGEQVVAQNRGTPTEQRTSAPVEVIHSPTKAAKQTPKIEGMLKVSAANQTPTSSMKPLFPRRSQEEHRHRQEQKKKDKKTRIISGDREKNRKTDSNTKKKQGKENHHNDQNVLYKKEQNARSTEDGSKKRTKGNIVSGPGTQALHSIFTELKVLDKDAERDESKKTQLSIERKSDKGLLTGENHRVRWWRKPGFY